MSPVTVADLGHLSYFKIPLCLDIKRFRNDLGYNEIWSRYFKMIISLSRDDVEISK